jgi:hypothetical protein
MGAEANPDIKLSGLPTKGGLEATNGSGPYMVPLLEDKGEDEGEVVTVDA